MSLGANVLLITVFLLLTCIHLQVTSARDSKNSFFENKYKKFGIINACSRYKYCIIKSKSESISNMMHWRVNMETLKNVVCFYENLKQEWTKTPSNFKKCGELLTQLKVALISLTFLPTSNSQASQKELLIARDILEIGAQWSIAMEDIPSFERYMAQLKCYYFDYKSSLPESAFKYQLLGLNLLFLLSQNRVAEFHTELELLPSDQIQSNIYIRHPLSLEQCLMEGSYNKIFLAKGNVPAASYNFFIDILLNTVRNEIGACMENAYDKISVKDAQRMLNLVSEKEMIAFATKKNWNLSKDRYFYFSTPCEKKVEEPIPSSDLVTLAIDYAKELEMIV